MTDKYFRGTRRCRYQVINNNIIIIIIIIITCWFMMPCCTCTLMMTFLSWWPLHTTHVELNRAPVQYLARDAFVRSLWPCPSVCLSGTGVYCDHTVHVSSDLSLLLDSETFWAPRHQPYPPIPNRLFPVAPGREVWINAN